MSREIDARLAFMNFNDGDRQVLQAASATVERMVGPALDKFYEQVRRTPETASFFRDEGHMVQAKGAQTRHWGRLARAQFDGEFAESVKRIGGVHARIGLEPRWYVGAYAIVLENLLAGVFREFGFWAWVRSGFSKPRAARLAPAMVKAALFDMELSTSVYFENTQADQHTVNAQLSGALGELSAGKLTTRLSGLPANFAIIETHFNEAVAHLRELIASVAQGTDQISTGSSEIAQASEDLARRTESNAASLEQTAAAVSQMDARLKATASAARETVSRADQTIETVASGRSVAEEAVQAMGRVSDSAKGIDSVIEGLDKIAFQTRVLAMNAAVEAGRAGEAGRGFAVVADLVSALAMRAEEEAKRARDQLTLTQADVVTAVQSVEKVDGALQNISGDVGQVHRLLGEMSADNQAQASAITEINAAIASMDQSTQQNAAMVEETSAAARNLLSEVSSLAEAASGFDVGASAGAAKPPRTPRAAKEGGYNSPVKALPAEAVAALTRPAGGDDWREF